MISNAEIPVIRGCGVPPERIAGTTMKAVQMYSPYGFRGKIGLIVPSTNTVNEPEFYRMAPNGVSIHTARIKLLGKATVESYHAMGAETERAAAELATAEVDVIAWGCTSGSVIIPRQQLEASMTKVAGVPAITTFGSVLAALSAMGAKRISLGTPYVDFVNKEEVRLIEKTGIEVVAWHGLKLGETQEERRGIGRVPPESLSRLVRYVDRPEADVIFLSCTNMATIEMIADLEKEVGKPVITSNLSTFWNAMRTMGLRDRLERFGSLLERY
ncbi:maleate cis-trans isomerase family protein [Shumkonia mesophila]|uniref:maleate cis-trans isomerase family protein n=1 Tax=Shumkonia mesophila TaxID=2838854 RepID=UPI002934F10F|nr:aspartate/glutamate racemase family protein [Shumkonia mesophila]